MALKTYKPATNGQRQLVLTTAAIKVLEARLGGAA